MKVVIVTSFPFPDGNATANRVRVFAEKLIDSGEANAVEIIATSTVKASEVLFSESISVVSLHVAPIDKTRFIARAIDEILIAFKLWSVARKAGGNIIMVTIPSVLLLVPLAFCSKPAKLIIDVRDAVWTYFPKNTLKGLAGSILGQVFKLAAKRADLVSVTNSYEAVSVKKVSGEQAIVVANGISEQKIEGFRKIALKPIAYPINLSYIGNVGIAQELGCLIDFASLYPRNVQVNVVGNGAMLTKLSAMSDDANLSNIVFHGAVPSADVADFMEAADVLFAQIGNDFKSAIPTKIFEYISAGRRVLLGLPEGPAKQVFQGFHGVEVFPVGNLAAMQQAFEKLASMKYGDSERKKNLTLLSEHHVREKAVVNFLSHLKTI